HDACVRADRSATLRAMGRRAAAPGDPRAVGLQPVWQPDCAAVRRACGASLHAGRGAGRRAEGGYRSNGRGGGRRHGACGGARSMRGAVWRHARRAADRAGWGAFGALGLATHLLGGGRARIDPGAVRRILVIRLDLLGDLIFSLPAVRALRAAYPRAELTLLTLPYTRPLVELVPEVDRVLTLDVNRYRRPAGWRHLDEVARLVRALRAARYDLCVALHGRPAGMLAVLSGARYRVGYAAH